MPIYEYKCNQCDKTFDVFYKTFSTAKEFETNATCPTCKTIALRQQSQTLEPMLFGTGFHKPSATKRSSWSGK